MVGINNTDEIDVNISDNSSSVVFKDDRLYNDVAFKVLQNQEKYGTIKCGKLSQNGKIKLVYDCGKYKSLNLIVNQLKPKEFLTIVSNIHDVINRIIENGFIKIENLLINESTIYVDIADFSVHLICLPLTTLLVENKEVARKQMENVICNAANKIQGISVSEVKKIFDEGNYVITHETIKEDEKKEVPGEVVEIERNQPEPKKTWNVALMALIVIGIISVLTGAAIMVSYEQLLGLVILVSGCLFGIVLYLILPKGTEMPNGDIVQPLVLQSTNIESRIKFNIESFPYTIGRQYGSVDGVIENQKTVGRVHCKITQNNGLYYIEDMNSMNGTFVNNKRLVQGQKAIINKGDTVRVSKIEFVVK